MRLVSEFKAFAIRGNVIDLAVGVIIGAAFSKIVSSLVANVITPPLGLLISGVDFSRLAVTLRAATGDEPAVTIDYGLFLQAMLDFLIVAIVIFFAIRTLNKLKRREAEAPKLPAAPSREEVLLTEIRDAIRDSRGEREPR